VRRIAQLARHYPHLETVPIRGNANSRLARLDAGEVDALLLAVAGLERIRAADRITEVLPVETMCPSLGAGVLGLQCRQDDTDTIDLVARLGCTTPWRQTSAERMLLHVLQGHCQSPIAGYATTGPAGELILDAMVFTLDGKTALHARESGDPTDPDTLGASVALALLKQGAKTIIDATSP
jgi:hydroxymethylbilane synthase